MKELKETEILKDSIALMETKIAGKLHLASNKLESKNVEIEKKSKELIHAN
jgi:hypothetical protein